MTTQHTDCCQGHQYEQGCKQKNTCMTLSRNGQTSGNIQA